MNVACPPPTSVGSPSSSTSRTWSPTPGSPPPPSTCARRSTGCSRRARSSSAAPTATGRASATPRPHLHEFGGRAGRRAALDPGREERRRHAPGDRRARAVLRARAHRHLRHRLGRQRLLPAGLQAARERQAGHRPRGQGGDLALLRARLRRVPLPAHRARAASRASAAPAGPGAARPAASAASGHAPGTRKRDGAAAGARGGGSACWPAATGPLNPSLIKETIVRKEPDFDERDHGFSTFSRCSRRMEKEGLLKRQQIGAGSGTWWPPTIGGGPTDVGGRKRLARARVRARVRVRWRLACSWSAVALVSVPCSLADTTPHTRPSTRPPPPWHGLTACRVLLEPRVRDMVRPRARSPVFRAASSVGRDTGLCPAGQAATGRSAPAPARARRSIRARPCSRPRWPA